MLLTHVEPRGAFDHLVPPESGNGPLVSLELNAGALEEFMELFEQTATDAQNTIAMERLGDALAFFGTAPTVHEMLKTLTRRRFIARTPGAWT